VSENETASSGNVFVALLLAWLFPGLGHAYLGRRRAGALFALIVTATFLLGLAYHGRLYTHEPDHPLTILATFACYGAGLLNIGARMLAESPAGDILSPTFEFGCSFLLTAGMMNLLLMLDAYDICTGAKS
jgi:4-amino-4-deoxy-L-arabinose transferase-like glycosyltransferase